MTEVGGRRLALERVDALLEVGIPVVLCAPNTGYRTNGRGDVAPPPAWQHAEPNRAVLDTYRHGHHTLAMVTGHGIDVVDLDRKTGVDLGQAPLSHELGLDLTPGGGWHLPVPGTGYGRAALRLNGSVVGDFLGGVAGGAARGLCYLPGSARPKYPGLDYVQQTPWDIDKLIDSDPDPVLLGILDASGISQSPRTSNHGGQPGDIALFLDIYSGRQADCRYGGSALERLIAESPRLVEGGRHPWAVRATARVVELIQAGCLDLRALTTLQDRFRAIKPESGGGEFTDLVQWAIASTDARTGCGGHVATLAAGAAVESNRADWAVVDLATVLAHPARPRPDLMTRSDGVSLIYPGLVHSLSGESESFKSGLLLWESAMLVSGGEHVLYLDFESDAHSVIERLLSMGADPADVAARFHYIRPHSGFQQKHLDLIPEHPYRLAVVDGVTEALSLSGGDTNSADSVARLYQQLPHQLAARFGPAVVLIDHVSKSRETRGRFAIGSQHKLAAISGAAYILEPDTPLSRGAQGSLNLKVAKDRPGAVRQECGVFNQADRTQAAAKVIVDSTGEHTIVSYRPPGPGLSGVLLSQLSGWLARQERPIPAAEAEAVFRNRHVHHALVSLVGAGFVEEVPGPTTRYRHIKHFIAGIDQITERGTDG